MLPADSISSCRSRFAERFRIFRYPHSSIRTQHHTLSSFALINRKWKIFNRIVHVHRVIVICLVTWFILYCSDNWSKQFIDLLSVNWLMPFNLWLVIDAKKTDCVATVVCRWRRQEVSKWIIMVNVHTFEWNEQINENETERMERTNEHGHKYYWNDSVLCTLSRRAYTANVVMESVDFIWLNN